MTRRFHCFSRVAALATFAVSSTTAFSQPAAENREPLQESSSSSVFENFPKVDAAVPYLDFAGAWPKRWRRDIAGVQGIIIPIENSPKLRGSHTLWRTPAFSELREADTALLKAAANYDGVLSHWKYEGPGCFAFEAVSADGPGAARSDGASLRFRFVSGDGVSTDALELISLQHTWFSVYDAAKDGDAESKTRGVILLAPGLFGTPEGAVERLIRALRSRNWTVLRMHAQPSRFTQQIVFEANADAPLDGPASRIAAEFDSRAAECAYAAQGAFEHLLTSRPALGALPRVAIGFSGGAMTMPTVVAREPEKYTAVVMVGGGAHYLLMSDRSSYSAFVNAVQVSWIGGEPTQEDKSRLHGAYLSRAGLDSFHTAAALKGKPVLMIQGTGDLAVPAPLGDVLWERCGRPERWLRTGGHEALFMNLVKDFTPMLDWIEKAVDTPREAVEPGAGSK